MKNGKPDFDDGTNSPDAIMNRMQYLRAGMSQEVTRVKEEAKDAVRWQTYVKKYPLACVGIAVLGGYMLVPGRREIVRPTEEQLDRLVEKGKIKIVSKTGAAASGGGMVQRLALLAATAGVRAAMAYVGKRIGETAE